MLSIVLNNGADQLRGYCAADMRLCLRIYRKPGFHDAAHIIIVLFSYIFSPISFYVLL